MIEDVKHFTNAARRSYPIPTDFEQTLKRFNLTTSALKPHKKPPIPRSKRIPVYESLPGEDGIVPDLPILGPELDGAKDKASKPYIPASFPAFPSIHTYKYTPESVDAVTVSDDWGIFDPDAPLEPIEGSPVPQPQRPLAAEEIPHGDPKKIREAAAKEAKAGEEALRRLMRASKVAKQKEIRSAAQRQAARRDRYNLWEMAMKEMLEDGTKGKRREGGMICSLVNGDKNRVEIADHSMIVSTEKAYCRKEVPRPGVRKAVGNAAGKH
jgi:Transcription factor TFIID complex subunit 8 C-term.